LAREHSLVYSARVADDDEAYVAHVFLRDALDVGGRNGSQVRKHVEGATPASAD
jgi:hypothetical protein